MGYPAIDSIKQKHTPELAKELSLFMAAHMYAMKGIAEKEKINCDYVLDRFVEAYQNQTDADRVKEVYERQLEDGLDYIQDVDFMNQRYVERVSLGPWGQKRHP